MATRLKTIFLKQECVTKSAFICLVLLGLIGAIVILCDCLLYTSISWSDLPSLISWLVAM